MSIAGEIDDLMLNVPSDLGNVFSGHSGGGHGGHHGGGLLGIFNWTLIATAVIDVALLHGCTLRPRAWHSVPLLLTGSA